MLVLAYRLVTMKNLILLCVSALMLPLSAAFSQTVSHTQTAPATLKPGSKVFIEPMDGFENYLAAAILKKKTPVVVVDSKEKADFIISGTAHVEKAGWAKTIFISGAPQAGASISVKEAGTGNLSYAYSVDKFNAARASQSTAEACAKHLKEFIDKSQK